jgi:DNA-binding NarL/FixJ family response regulator
MPKPRILCIEDNPGTAELIVEVLEEEGFEVAVAYNGLDGIAALANRPDIVLCDVDMPDLSGFQVLTSIRERNLLPADVPFIFITAFSQRSYQVQARQLGCDDFVTKPIDFELLIAILRNRLAKAQGPAPENVGFRLTDRESEALAWVARGKSSADIATILGVSERTVNFHIDNVIRKSGVATRVQAAVKCALLGLIKP